MNLAFQGTSVIGRHVSAERFAKVRAALNDRARRREHLSSEFLTEPAWDIMLELYAFEILRHQPTVAELTGRINVPVSTAIRWMKALETDDLIGSNLRPYTDALVWVGLTSKGSDAMDAYFSASR
jgi:DNA-binding MarR family transcriptional regulator